MKDQYSIGETANLLGISRQTLHYYDKVGLVKPAYINKETGYRYYHFSQFQRIDRIKYLQRLGFTLEEIQASIESVGDMMSALENRKKALLTQKQELLDSIDLVDWYMDYFRYLDQIGRKNNAYILHLPQRFGIVVPLYRNELSRDAEYRMVELKGQPPYNKLLYLRQYGYQLDYHQMKRGKLQPTGYYTFLKNKPKEYIPNLIEFPEGDYLCFTFQLQKELSITRWDHVEYLSVLDHQPEPSLVLANEYENNFEEFDFCKYEIQILMK